MNGLPAPGPWRIVNGWLQGAAVRHLPSPHCDLRPAGEIISLLVIHNISLPPGEYGSCHVDALFCNELNPTAHPYFATLAGLRVSAHVLVDRQGLVTQYVPFGLRAWHAGASRFGERERCNDFSIGIELEGSDEQPYEEAQYQSLAAISQCLLLEYPAINRHNIVGHCHIAPGRKTDPGPAFDWSRYRDSLAFQEIVT